MKRFAVLTILLLTLTACAAVNVPPVDYDEPSVEITELETMTESPATTETTAPTRPAATKATKASASGDEDQTETVTESLVIPDWAEAYAALIRQKNILPVSQCQKSASGEITVCSSAVTVHADRNRRVFSPEIEPAVQLCPVIRCYRHCFEWLCFDPEHQRFHLCRVPVVLFSLQQRMRIILTFSRRMEYKSIQPEKGSEEKHNKDTEYNNQPEHVYFLQKLSAFLQQSSVPAVFAVDIFEQFRETAFRCV